MTIPKVGDLCRVSFNDYSHTRDGRVTKAVVVFLSYQKLRHERFVVSVRYTFVDLEGKKLIFEQKNIWSIKILSKFQDVEE